MKKLAVFLLLLLMPITSVFAYESKYFDIEVPENYELTMEKGSTYQWVNAEEGANYVVTIGLKSEGKNLIDYTKEEKIEFVAGMITELEAQYYAAYEEKVDVELIISEEIKQNGYEGIYIKVKVEDFLGTGSEMNQYINVFESKNFLYSIVYSTAEKTYNEEDYNKVKESFTINDELINNNSQNVFQRILDIITLVAAILFGFYLGRRTKYGKKQQ